MIAKEVRKSELFNMLARLGLLSTEERRIRKFRENDSQLYHSLDLTYDDIERIGYLYPHFAISPRYAGMIEVWIKDHYVNPCATTWIETNSYLYGVVDDHYDESQNDVRCFYNPSILYRFNNIGEEGIEYTHTYTIDTTELKWSGTPNLEHAAYYISQDKYYVPQTEWIDETHLRFTAPYMHDIDFFICSNLANVVTATANQGVLLDQLNSNRCYHRILIDHDASYPMDARFYPYVKVDKDCVIRVFTDSYHILLHPDSSRLLLYPEFLEVEDPYNTENEYLNQLPFVDDIIESIDTDEEIIEKFNKISAYCYRLWEKYPYDYLNEQSDFVICDNHKFAEKTFVEHEVSLYDQKIHKICSLVPYEPYRDILFYHGVIFSDYIIRNITKTSDGNWIESNTGIPTYLIDNSYEVDGFTLIKFNAFEDATYINIGEYINEEQVARLHFKLNRFYRNLLILRREFITNKDKVRVATVQPTVKDEYMWYELLVNAIPEMFQGNTVDLINLYGLDPNNIPEDVQEGAYMLELDPLDGPASYNQMLMTYFKLSKAKRNYLALQYGEGIDDPRIKTFDHLHFGKPEDHEILNEVIIEDETVDSKETEFEYGVPVDSGTEGHEPGDIYVQIPPRDAPPGEENVDIDIISTGPAEPEQKDEHVLWISTDDNPYIPDADSLDGETSTIHFVNDIEGLTDVEKGEYAVDSIPDTFTEEQEGEVPIDDLLEDIFDDEEEELPDIPEEDDDNDPINDDLFSGVSEAVAENIQVEEVKDPRIGQVALDDIEYVNSETGKVLSKEEIEQLDRDYKLASIHKLITDDDTPESAQIGDMWMDYLSKASDEVLNTICYRVFLTKYVWDIHQPNDGSLAIEGKNLPETEETITYGSYPKWVKPDQMIISPFVYDEEGNVTPDYDTIYKQNLKYIMNWDEPDDPEEGDIWLQMPAAYLGKIIFDVISQTIIELGEEEPEGYYFDDGRNIYATMAFDYDSHDHGTPGHGEIFQEVKTDELTPIYYGDMIDETTLDEGDIWYEFLDTINDRVAYSDMYTMVLRMDERLLLLEFDHDNIQAYAFDDIVMNFRGRLGLRYLTLVSDLINSGEINLEDINIFYHRLITFGDDFDPKLTRLYTGHSHVITKPKVDTTDYSIIYSTNIGRFRIDYNAEDTTRKEREAAYRHVIDYTTRDFAYLHDKMIVFVNGKHIPNIDCVEVSANKIEIKNFNEIIATVDIFYSKKDKMLMDLKKSAYQYWPVPDESTYIQRPERDYKKMEYIHIDEFTYRGYYDVLIQEYILSGKLLRIINYLMEHPEEQEDFRRDMIHHFHAISDTDLSNMNLYQSKIIIPAFSTGPDTPYQIGYQSPDEP